MSKKINKSLVPSYQIHSYQNYDKVMDAYRSSIGNLFTSNDSTLSTTGDVEKLIYSGYWGDVIKSLKIYQHDPIVKKIVDETVSCANTQLMFSVTDADEKTKVVYQEWTNRINEEIPHILTGTRTVVEWMLLSLLKTGMAVPDFEWGDMEIDGKKYNLPTKLTVHPTLAIKIKSDPIRFGYEEVWLGLSSAYEKNVMAIAADDKNYTVRYVELNARRQAGQIVKSLSDVWHDTRKNKSDVLCVKKPNAIPLKLKWSPQEPTYYPIPPLKPLFGAIAMKHKLQEADLSLLQRVIHRIIHVKVGDKDNPPQPDVYDKHHNLVQKGTIQQYSEMWQEGEGTQIFTTDYTVEINDLIPDLALVLNQTKYLPCLQEIMGAFGITQDPDTKVGSGPHTQLNLIKYENYLEDLQKLIGAYFNWIIRQIAERNPQLKPAKVMLRQPYIDPNTQKSLWDMWQGGAIDIETVLEAHDFDPSQIRERKLKQLEDKMKDGTNIWTPPPSLVQIAKNNQEEKKEELGGDSEKGRPSKKEKKEMEAKPKIKEVNQTKGEE